MKGSPHSRDIPMLVPLMAGISARILAVTFVSPIELIRTKMQSQKMTNAEMFSTVRLVMQSQGILGLWRGLPPTILRDVPFSGIYWTCYEYFKSKFNVGEPTFGFSFMAGAISGSVSCKASNIMSIESISFSLRLQQQLPLHSMLSRLMSKLSLVRNSYFQVGPPPRPLLCKLLVVLQMTFRFA